MSSEVESHDVETPFASPRLVPLPDTPVHQKTALPYHTPTDSLVSVSLSESDAKSEGSIYSVETAPKDAGEESIYSLETTPKDVVEEVIRRASCHTSPIEFMISEKVLDSPGAAVRLVQEL